MRFLLLVFLVILLPQQVAGQCSLPEAWYDPEGTDATGTTWWCGASLDVEVTQTQLLYPDPSTCTGSADDIEMNGEFEVVHTTVDNDASISFCTQAYVHARAMLINDAAAVSATDAAGCVDELSAAITGPTTIHDLWVVDNTPRIGNEFGDYNIAETHGLQGDYQAEVYTGTNNMESLLCAASCDSKININQQLISITVCGLSSSSYEEPYRTQMRVDGWFPDGEVYGDPYDDNSGTIALVAGLSVYCARYERSADGNELNLWIRTDQMDQPNCFGPDADYTADATYVKFVLTGSGCCPNPCGDGTCEPNFDGTTTCSCAPGYYPPECKTADELCSDWSAWGPCLPQGCSRAGPGCPVRPCGGCPVYQLRTRTCPPDVDSSETSERQRCDNDRKCVVGRDSPLEIISKGITKKGKLYISVRHRKCCILYRHGNKRVRKPKGCYRRRVNGWKD